MNIARPAKFLSMAVMVVGMAVGCASTPPQEQTAPKPEAKTMGPSHEVTMAIAEAKEAVKTCHTLQWEWTTTDGLLKKAESDAAKGDNAKALKLAHEARDQATLAVNQYYLEKAKILEQHAQAMHRHLTAQQMARVKEASQAILDHEGRKAYDILTEVVAAGSAASTAARYTVAHGDSLWRIAARADVYGNPLEWPLIYKANSRRIKDADLIFPGQTFNVDRTPSAGDVAAAERHARERGPWVLGATEDSDIAYLGKLKLH